MNNPTQSTLLPGKRWKRGLVSAFIVFNVVAVNFGVGKPAPARNFAENFFFPYLHWSKLLQQWKLFVPDPRDFVKKYSVEITFMDGSHQTWQRPYPPNWDFFERHLAYNFQKWDLANAYFEYYPWIQEDLLDYVERLYWNPANRPRMIDLISSTAPVPPPHESGYVLHDLTELVWTDKVLAHRRISENVAPP